ncbi:MAG: hypothetical protein ACTSO2_14785 [Promethearchaeota archaeon]
MKLSTKRLKLEMARYRIMQNQSKKIKNKKFQKKKIKLRSIYWHRVKNNL